MDGKSLDILSEKFSKLKELFPEAFTEDKVDWEKLKAALGDVNIDNERYNLNWAGKSDAFRVLQQRTSATLTPVPEESYPPPKDSPPGRGEGVGLFTEESQNLFIEGENLEVLKVLQKSYFGKIKMIYIDPPYNTGNDSFIYPDKFAESKEEYLKRIGDKSEEGYLLKEGFFRKNSKDSGHYHSNWLSMMYPRLYVARNLLKDDGVIFISIDDNEVHNLRMIMNEIFGEENFIACIANVNNPKGRSDDKFIATAHEYLLVYKKSETELYGFKPEKKVLRRYNKIDKDNKKYREIDLRKTGDNDLREDRPNLFYFFYFNSETNGFYPSKEETAPEGFIKIFPTREDGREGNWRWELNTSKDNIYLLEPKYMIVRKKWTVIERDYLSNNLMIKSTSAWITKDVNSERGSESFIELGFDKKIFPKPKTIGVIKRSLELSTKDNDIILDFFAGSGTTAQAVLEINKKDGRNRKFILVQLPEKTSEDSEAYKAKYFTIADICKERIRRVIEKLENAESPPLIVSESQPQLELNNDSVINSSMLSHSEPDLSGEESKKHFGFQVFKLSPSNFKHWRSDLVESEEDLNKMIDLFDTQLKTGALEMNMLYELILKSGYTLTDKIDEKKDWYLVADKLVVVLTKIDQTIIDEILKNKPQTCIILDNLFADNDQLKTNTALQMKDAGVELVTV